MSENRATPITVAYGDGIGPEIMDAVLEILTKANAKLSIETIEVGEAMYKKGHSSGISEKALESIRRTGVLLKAPITTPQGGGYKSLNVTMRKALRLYANVRPTVSYHPYVETHFPKMDMVIVRENEEDLYAGIEYRQTQETYECLKLITRTGCENIVRYAFNYAVKNNRKKVTCLVKDNIMKMTDGIFHKVFDEVAKEYPAIHSDHYIVDIGAARIAAKPEIFDVVVTSNLYGDIVSDIAAEVSGSVGLAGSANIGKEYAMFEAIHGSAPDIAGKDIANPSGLLQGALMMLVHIGDAESATRIQNAWLATLEDGIHTADIYNEAHSKKKVGTKAFANAVIERLGTSPKHFNVAHYTSSDNQSSVATNSLKKSTETKTLVGVDVFVDFVGKVSHLAEKINKISELPLTLSYIASKGLKLWPDTKDGDTFLADHWVCRMVPEKNASITKKMIIKLLDLLYQADIDFIKTEHLYEFNGERAFTLAQGE